MIESAPNINAVWAALIVEELVRNGITTFVVSPGSRSTPLTVAAARHPETKTVVHFDERGAAYFAVGCARTRGDACALICTSGTAVANYLPAIVEASQSLLPLIVLSADRPPELLDSGANQAIDQHRLFGNYVRWHQSLPCPDPAIPVEVVLTTVDQATIRARFTPAGPVHINCLFREPLVPSISQERLDSGVQSPPRWRSSILPYTRYTLGRQSSASPDAIGGQIRQMVTGAKRGLLLVGGASPTFNVNGLVEHADSIRWPIWADITSGLRLGAPTPPFIAHYDQLLLSSKFNDSCRPDVVLHLGGPITSKRVNQLIERLPDIHYIRVTNHPLRHDPAHRVGVRLIVDSPAELIEELATLTTHAPREWMASHAAADKTVRETFSAELDAMEALTEPGIARRIARNGGNSLFLGNSMPVRDFDMFADSGAPPTEVVVNRGASGIDGNIATAAGYSFASNRPIVAIIGDLAALHDLNSLELARRPGVKLIAVIINNNGSAIFHWLSISEQRDVFETYFATPHGLRFEHAARQFGLPYRNPETMTELLQAVNDALHSGQSAVIEVNTDRTENLRIHNALANAVVAALDRE
jgi:2-succinyl-5-enolpyruvyl-6-hydroxy-3-cyclohexene-1-carboxylate synthase